MHQKTRDSDVNKDILLYHNEVLASQFTSVTAATTRHLLLICLLLFAFTNVTITVTVAVTGQCS